MSLNKPRSVSLHISPNFGYSALTLDLAILDVVAKVSASEPSIHQAEICSRSSESYLQSLQLNSSDALENSIVLGSIAVKYVQTDDPNRGIVISMFARAVVDTPNRPLHFDDLGCSLRDRYFRHHKPVDFDAAQLAVGSATAIPHSGEPGDKALFVQVQDNRRSLLEERLDAHLKAIACVTPEYRGVVQILYRHLVETYLDLYPIDGIALSFGFRRKVEEAIKASGKR
ncbi:unnamed protein product [Cyclocybe aegerita]|uniref:Uncharacterized protein n=1 Tax=Cyclocybe aegerita TaxID=1973307 RepID=A0A8S0XS67_CYCAE|nr:unnamed protein product [Cyclocybe aegerita]